MQSDYYIEVECLQKNPGKQVICGDVFMSEKIKEEGRTLLVLSDGLGSGIKANVLGTLTASMVINYMRVNKDIRKAAEVIMQTLPICSKRKASYSTFTIVDIECDGETRIIRYDNPECLVLRGLESFQPKCEELSIEGANNLGKTLYSYRFKAEKEDRIVFCSDGVTNSGMGTKRFPFGWGTENLNEFVRGMIRRQPYLSAKQLSRAVVDKAVANYSDVPKDDTSCAVVYLREPRNLLLCTGPPYSKSKDAQLAGWVSEFKGKKIACGGTTASILSREFGEEIRVRIYNPTFFGTVCGNAPHAKTQIRVDIYVCEIIGEPRPNAEISDIRWVPYENDMNISIPTQLALEILHEKGRL